ncbi:ATP-binding protein [Flavihumibacter sp. RY-1]|uniref:histidine kinase n=1 Tax=Flavihumibacter fluminis TaxID=2909236 RepID=A0ABS9BCH0_9BACT|nr:HAMP domain-containing sensor histidine kinase [Flavihumibacter fluminis]MCF1713331.1 ATP-binding protein [Flavihumibacter fluminis]
MELELFKNLSRYPFIFNNEFFDSIELKQNKTCIEKCEKRDCLSLALSNAGQVEYICSKGYNNLLVITNGFKFILNGLIYETNTTVPQGRKEVRKNWIVQKDAINVFVTKIQEIENYIIQRENESIEKNFSLFHDFKTSMSIFFNCTESIIAGLPGNTFEEKLQNSGSSYKDLYNSLELITSQLGMIDVIINPKSISFGNKRNINIYKLFYKIKMLFNYLAAKKRNISIELINVDGAYIHNSFCFESIEFIPLILLDNALKYSSPDSNIKIEITQLYGRAKIRVKNIGPFVSDANKDKIFEKFFRDESAKSFSKEGIGMGLWIAQEILKTHGSKLYYFKDQNEFRPIGLNIFEFDLETY